MDIVIRKAEYVDRDTLFTLICALADYEHLDRPTIESRDRLFDHAWGARPRFEAWIAEAAGDAVGYSIVFETYSTFLAQPTLYLEDLFILPEYRKLGIGTKMFEVLVHEAVNRECGRMEWACLDWNEIGLSFYRKIGAAKLHEWITFRLSESDLQTLTASKNGAKPL